MATDQSIGLMDGAYFVGRREIIEWVNQTCCLNLSKIEQTCNGAIACQLLDSIFPGKVPMSKVDWSASKDYQYIHNYKILQKCFTKLGIERHIEVDRLIRGKAQDNLEFMQWFKKFHELKSTNSEYDGENQRAKGKGGSEYTERFKAGGGSGAQPQRRRPPPASKATTKVNASTKQPSSTLQTANAKATRPTGAPNRAPTPGSNEQEQVMKQLKTEIEELSNENGELRTTVDGLEKERDFYFGKLRDVEIFLQSLEDSNNNELAQSVFKILYATDDDFEENDTGLAAVAPEESTTSSKVEDHVSQDMPIQEEY